MLKTRNKMLLFLFILAIAVRFACYMSMPVQKRKAIIANDGTDACWYHSLALDIIETGEYNKEEFFRVPVYPYFVSIFYRMSGLGNINVNTWSLIVFTQFISSAMTCILLFLIAEMLFNKNVGFLAGLLLAVNPDDIFYSNIMLSENLFNLFFMTNIFFLVKFFYSKEKNMHYLIGLSLALAAASLTRSVSCFFIFFIVFLIFIKLRRNLKRAAVCGLVALSVFYAALFPWMWRNYLLSGAFRLTLPVVFLEENIRILETARLKQDISSPEVTEVNLQRLENSELKELKNTNKPKEKFNLLFAYLHKLALRHPFIYAKLWLTGFFRIYLYQENFNFVTTFFSKFFREGYKEPFLSDILSGIKNGSIFSDYNRFVPAFIKVGSYLMYLLFYLLAGYGLLRMFLLKDRRIMALLFLGVIIYFPFLLGILGVSCFARYRFPAVPTILLCSAIGIYFIYLKLKKVDADSTNTGDAK